MIDFNRLHKSFMKTIGSALIPKVMMAKSFSLAVNGSGRCLSKLSNLSIGAIGFVDSYLKILFTGHRSAVRLIGLLTFVLVVQTLPFLQVNAQTIGSTITFEAGSARLLTGASTNPSATNIDGHSLGVSAVTSGNIVNITVNNTVSGISGGSDLAVIMTATGTNVTSFSYKSDNAANNFSLTSFAFAVATGTTQNITVQGYDNGSAVSGAITKTISSAGTTNFTVTSGDISASSGWGNIDEVRMTMNTPAPANFAIDDVLLAAAVASNNAPTASAFTANPSENLTYTFSTNDFGYNDSDSDPLDHVLIESVPANGTLYLDADNDDVFDGGEAVSVSQQISKADLDAGNLQYIQNGSTGSSFQFEVNDGTDNSTGNYIATLTMLPVPTVTLSLVTSSKSESLTTANGITATLSNSYGANTVVKLAFSGSATGSGVDYSVSSTSNTIVLTNVPDALYEGNEEVDIDISTVTNGTENGTQQQTFTIIDDDSQPNATLEVLSIYNPLTDESGGQAYVRGKIDAVAGTTITIPLSFSGTASGGGTDYSITGSSIELSPGETMDSIRITSQYDGIEEGSETVIVDMGSPTNAIESGTQQVTITIIDEDATPPRINSIVRQSPSSSPTNADLLVWDVTFNEAVSNVGAADFTVSGTTGTISSVTNPSGNTYRVTVSGGDLASLNGTVTLGFAGGQDIVDSFGTALSNTTPTGTNDNTFVVDNSAPAAPSTPDMTTATDSGNEEHTAGSTSDNLTKNTTPTFEGTAESGATVKIISNIDGEVGSGTATGGTYSITTSALTAGAHTITATATDASANTSSASSALSITIDTTSPTVSISTTSSNPTNDNPIPVTITFNSEADNMKENDITVVNGTTGDFASPDSTSFTVSITPSGNGIVQVSVAAGSAFDRAGNANTVSNTLSLTYDGTAPAFSSVSPSSSSAVNTANVGYTLSEAIASGTVTFTRTSGTADGSSPHVVTLTGSELNAGARASAALANAPTLVSGTVYTISFDGQDAAGNSATTVNVTNVTFDNTAPIFDGVNSTPADGATDVGAADNLVLDFSENIAAGTGNITIRDVTGSTNFEVFDIATATATSTPANGALGISNDKLYINPTNSFTETNAYSVRIDANAIDDASGNSFAGVTNDTDYNFSVADVTAPTIQSSSPADGASNVTLSQNLTITFDDNMAVGTGNITIVETGVGNFEQLDVTNGTLVSVSGATVTLNPAGTLKKGTNYHIEIDALALDDDAGNDFVGIADATTLNFKTVDVVINEVVTDPQQDWSTNGFDGTFPGSPTVTAGTDEWVELYIRSAGIDFTGWTIELTDGTDFSGDLTNTGAFDVSNYVSSGSGTFNGSESGDYLILGDPDGGSAMNNDVLIVLKDPGGAIVDQLQLGGGAGEAPSGDATSRSDESVQRIPNGTDTDADDADFVQAAASIGAVNDASGPQITSLGLHNSNSFIEIFANEGLYSTNGGSGALEVSDIDISISGGTAHTPVVTSLKQLNGTSDLVGGESMIRVNFTTTGVADGGETITINFADGSSVFDAAGNAAAATQSNNTRILNDLVDPYITGVSLASDNSYIDVTFNEGVYEDNCGGGGLTAADFDLQISNGTATVPVISSVKQNDSAAEGSASALAGGETTIRIFFSVTGTPDGAETLEVDLQANEVFDINGRTGVADQTTNNTATLNDEASPTVLEVTSDASNGSFKVDDEINIYVQYSEEVFVTGTPQLELETGTTDRTIDYVDRSVSTLRFVYTVQAGDVNADLDVKSSSAFTLNGGTIQDAAGNNAVLTVPQNATGGSLKQNKDLVIDGVVPSITSLGLHNGNAFIEIFANEGLYSTNGGSGALEVSDIDISISGGTAHTPVVTSLKQLNGTSDLVGGENMIRVNFTTTGVADGGETITINFADGSSVFDAAGNAAAATQSNNTRILNDLVDPYITGVSLASDNSYIDVTFNEGVYEDNCGGGGLTAADFDLQISNGTATLPVISSVKQNDNTAEASATALSGGETTIRIFFSVTGTPDGGETLEVDLQANEVFDINGRTGVADQTTNNTVTLNDEAAPTVTSIARQSPTTTPTNADQLVWDVTFDEVVANVGTADFSVSGTTGTVTTVTNPSGNVYRVTASGGDLASLNATVTLSFAGVQDIADAAGNALVNTTPTGTNNNTFVVDNTAPRVTSIARQSPTTTPTNADQLVWDVTFDEAVANVGTADFSVSGTTGTVTSVTNPSGNVYRVTASGGDLASLNATVTLSFSGAQDIADAAGNALANTTPTGTNNNTFVVDNTAPRVTSIARQSPTTTPTNVDQLVWDVTFDEAVANVGTADFSVSGTKGTVTSVTNPSGNVYRVTASGGDLASLNATVTLSFSGAQDIADAAGNALANTTPTGTNNNTFVVDNTAPRVTSIARQSPTTTPTNVDQLVWDVTFDEAVANVGTADFSVSGTKGTVTSVTNPSGNVYRVTASGGDLASLNATVTLSFSGAQDIADAAGNALVNTTPTGTNNNTFVVDNTAPRVTSIARQSPTTTPTNADQLVWDVTFDEAVANVGTADFSVSGTTGTVTSVTNPSGNVYRVTASGGDLASLNATVTLSFSGAQDIADAAGNALVNTTPTGTNNNTFVVDNTAATITSITAPADGSYNSGKNLTFTVAFSDAVNYDDGSSCEPPYLVIDVGGSTKAATYASGNGTNTWTFTYSVGVTDNDSDGIVISSFDVGDVGVEDEAGNALNTTLPTLPNTSAILVDNAAPTISTLSPADNATGVSLNGDFTLTFNEDVVANTGNVTVHRVSDDGVVRTFDVTNHTVVSISGSVVTFDNTSDLALITEHYIMVDNGAFEDVAGNAFGGIISTSAWSFTTTDQTEISINDPSVAEGESGSTSLTFTVSLSQPAPAGGATVAYATSDGTASSASDYTAASGTVSFAVGESSKTITVSVAGDAIVEDDETITVTLTSPTGTNMVIGDGTGSGTITNDDQATVTIADVTVDEEDGTATVSLVLDKAVDGGLTVDLSTADGTATTADSDYTALVSSPVTFTGTVGESKNVNITIGSDSKLEANETFTVAMSNLTPATVASGDIDVTDGATVTINNDDTATVTIADESGNEDDGAITLTATLDNPVQGGFTVEVITVDGTATVANSDYTALVGQSLTFAGTAGETETFTVTPGLDAIVEANETFKVSMTNLSATTLAVGVSDEATVTITNDDAATFAIDDVTKNENADGGATTTYTFTATLTGSIDQAISVDYATSNGTASASDYTAATGTLNFTGTDGETQTFNVTVANDDIVELDETFTVTLSNVQAGGKNVTISDATGLGTITNDDAASISIDDVSKAENADGGATTDFVFTVTLNKAVDTGISLSYATNDATATTADGDYTSASGQLNFAGTAGETEEITVTVANDGLAEFDEGFGVTLSSLQASGRNVTISDNVGLGTIENDDTAGFTITETAGSTETTEAGGTDSFDVVLDAEPLSDVVISITSGDTGEGTVSASTLTFTTANWNTAQTVTVTGVDDDIIDGTQSFNITLAIEDATSDDVYDPVADQTVSVDNTDNDIAGFTISKTTATVSETGTTDQFTVVLDAEPASDVVINVSSNDTGEATVGSSALTFTSINWDTPQFVTITGTDDAIEDGHVMSTITLSIDVATSDSDFGGLADQTVTVTTNDDDDLTAPAGYSVTLGDALVGDAEVSTSTFTFAGAEVGTTYNYTVSSDNGGTNVTGSGTIATATDQITLADLSGLNDGTLTLSVTLTDASSNVGTAATDDTVLDTTAPVAPVVTSVSDDTGSSASDGITSDNTPSVNGTAEANATIEVFVDGNSVGTTTADASGDWTLAYTGVAPLTDGTIAVTANATDAAGNTGATSTAVNVTVDTTAPAAATFNGITNDTGASSTDAIINDMSSVTISGTAEANATFDLIFNGVTYSGLSVDGSGNWSMDISNTLTEDATETVTITITDAAGNTSAAATYDITLDITVPEAPTVGLDATSDKGTSDSDDLTNYTIGDAMTFSGTAEASASVEVELTYNGTTFTGLPATTDGSGNWSINVGSTIGGILVDGTVNDLTLRAIATDVAGNVGTAGELTIVLDQALDATLTPADNATDVLPNANLVMDFSEDVYKGTGNITIKQSSDNTVLETIDITSANVVVSGAEVTIDPTSLLLPPSEEFYVTVDAGTFTDDAGNSYVGISNNTAWTFTIIAAPVVTSVSVPAADTYGIGDELEFTVNFTLPVNTSGSLSLPITLGASAKEATVAADASNSNSLTFSYTIAEGDLDTDGIAIGSNINLNGGSIVDQFATNAILALNNVASTAAINVDGIRAIPTLSTATGSLTNEALTVTVTYDEQVTGLELTDFTIANGTASDLSVVTAGLVWTATVTPSADGAVSVTLPAGTVNDQAGNTSAASANTISTTFDGTAPAVSSITRAEADQLNTADTDANFTVTFSEDVTGVDVTDFETVVTGSATASINSVTVVDAKTYTVNVNGISGEGTIGLNLKANSSILDAATNALTADFTGDVYTTNYLPTAIGLSSSSIDENSAVGSVVGTIASTDQDATDSHTYTLVAGTGDADNASFSMNGDQLLTAEVFDFETKDSYSIRVKTDDGFGGTFEQALTITVDNVLEYSVFVTGEGAFEETILGFSTTKTWTATNNGELPVEVRVASTPTGFSVVPGSFILGVGESKEISAVFTPESAREYSGNVVFDYEGGVEVEAVSGEGVIVTDVDDQLIDEAAISVYPNPASDVITLDLTELYGLPVDVNIYNATGKPMFTKKDITDSKVEVRVTSYESGIYIVRFSNDKSVVNKKVMIKR